MKNLLLLHGAIGSSKQLEPLKNILSNDYDVYTLDFSGHGGNTIPVEDFSIDLFANDVLKFLDETAIDKIDVFGYSMGGYVALYLARFYPEKVNKIFTLATKFDWNVEGSVKEAAMLNAETIALKIPAFAEELAIRHQPADWKILLQKTADMILAMGKINVLTDADFKEIKHSVLIGVGGKDKMVSQEETLHVQQLLSNSNYILFNETPHPIEKVNMQLLADEIKKFVG
jgi:pimeloyl-ACP methyl ester carboxylesterase